ncbi:hypothetical protein ABZ943_42145 [Streptomyces rubiginosohelvolus]|uniref:hypothetical protein n=1 Tax=Streptomyces rubiginosohelvolus TaxID=67362 RepID=UPI0033CB49D2
MHDENSLWRESGLRLSGFGHYYPRLLVENETGDDPAGNAVVRLTTVDGEHAPPLLVELGGR